MLADQEPIDRYVNVLSGVVKLSKLLEDGRQQIVGLQFTGVSNVNAEAATDTKLCFFSKAALERAVSGSHEMTNRLHAQSVRELDDAREWMLTLETVSRQMALFRKNGIIDFSKSKHIAVLDLNALSAACGG